MPLPLFYRQENRCRGSSPCPRSNKEGAGKTEPMAHSHWHIFLPLWKGELHPQANLSLCLHCVTAITFISCFLTIPPPGIKNTKTKTNHLLHAFLMLWGLCTEHYWWGLERKIFIYQKRRNYETINGLKFILVYLNCMVYDIIVFPGGASGKEPTCQRRRHERRGFDPWVGTITWTLWH